MVRDLVHSGVDFHDLQVRPTSLEEAFFALTEQSPIPARSVRRRLPVQLTLAHARFQFLETVHVPIAVVGNCLFPPLVLLFFVVPIEAVRTDPAASTMAVAQVAVMSTVCFTFGVGVSEDRARPWDGYVHALPAGPGPRLAGRLLTGLAFALLG